MITKVLPGSIAEEMGIEPGDRLMEINGEMIEDVFDYRFDIKDELVEVLIRKADGEEWLLEIEKEYDEDLGAEFETELMSDYKSCCNKCIFCFIDQMPEGMRESLYFKDDDSRLSFMQGNYITLTNMKEKDIERIIRYHLAPINISVQTTNPVLRCEMLHNRFAGDVLKYMDRLYAHEIEMNGQIVVCQGVNDGDELVRTLNDLERYIPFMRSVSVVPSGLTKYRKGLYPLEVFGREKAQETICIVERKQKECMKQHGIHFVHASDELYDLAGWEMPEAGRYDGYLQLENGVGMMRLLRNEFQEALELLKNDSETMNRLRGLEQKTVSIATGLLAYDLIQNLCDTMTEVIESLEIRCYPIINHYFGEKITVSGLITATDLTDQLKDRELGDMLLLPSNILRSGEDVFLDDITLEELKNTLQVDINIVESSGQGFIDGVLQVFAPETEKKHKENGNFVYIKAYDREQE